MKTRTDLLNHLAEKHGLISYLEIGVQDPKQNFDKIICPQKVSVDPDPKSGATWQMTSDEFFAGEFYLGIQPDLVFIDGLHTAEQVRKDFENALKILSLGGFIVLHDCNPEKEEHTIVPRPTKTGHWNGDVYKFAATIGRAKHTIDIDNGCMIVYGNHVYVPKPQRSFYLDRFPDWQTFSSNRIGLLNLISWDEFISTDSHIQ
jgi:hypothetical protein